jgi:DNA-binding XRE family transcriptional regulator
MASRTKAGTISKSPAKKKGTSRTSQDKRDLAKLLYTKNELNRKEVAARVGVNEKTVGKWVEEYGWDDMRKSLLVTREEELRNLLDQLSELNAKIKARPKGERYGDPSEANTQGQITASIRKLTTETGLTEIMDICPKILGFAQKNFPEHIKVTIAILDAFVNQYLR